MNSMIYANRMIYMNSMVSMSSMISMYSMYNMTSRREEEASLGFYWAILAVLEASWDCHGNRIGAIFGFLGAILGGLLGVFVRRR
eukprot:3313186-Pyramimonas_sp.AAC.1